MKNPFVKFAAIGFAVLALTTSAKAALLLTSAGTGSAFNNNGSFGFSFTLSTSTTLTSLGIYDAANPSGTQGDGLLTSHEVQLYLQDPLNSSLGTLIASVTFAASTTGADAAGFIFATPTFGSGIALLANTTYVLAATNYTSGSGDNFVYNSSGATAPTVSSGVTLLQDRTNGGTAFPSSGFGGVATVGPNLQFAAIPEPSTCALLFGVGALFGIRSLRNRRA